jgi:RHS repeat-associated protein
LEIAGISSKALGFGGSENRYKYNGIEHDNDLDLNIDEAFYRNLDPTIGRWWQIDPKVDAGYESVSPYASMYDNPVRYSDPLGDEADGDGDSPGFLSRLGSAIVESGKQLVAATGGALNAWSSNQILGVGRVDANDLSGASFATKIAYKVGQSVGDAASIVTGAVEDIAAGAGEIASLGIATPLAIPVAIHGATSIGMGSYNLIKGALNPVKNDGSSSGGNKTNPSVTTKKDRIVTDKPGEKALNQVEGIGKNQDAAKKNKAPGQKKQTQIERMKKSDDNLRNVLKNTKTLKDAQENF